jgi:predicted enzyme related to lactoylglutathione lyase
VGRIIHVELTAADPEKAAAFYAEAFGWKSEPSPIIDGYFVADTGDGKGIDGAIMSHDYKRQPAIPWIQVDDMGATIAAVHKAGGTVSGEVHEHPELGTLAYVQTPDGVTLGLRHWPSRP